MHQSRKVLAAFSVLKRNVHMWSSFRGVFSIGDENDGVTFRWRSNKFASFGRRFQSRLSKLKKKPSGLGKKRRDGIFLYPHSRRWRGGFNSWGFVVLWEQDDENRLFDALIPIFHYSRRRFYLRQRDRSPREEQAARFNRGFAELALIYPTLGSIRAKRFKIVSFNVYINFWRKNII